jgi:hypothetical protein
VVVGSGGTFGASTLRPEIGLGGADRVTELVVAWPGSGLVQRFAEVAANRFYRLIEGNPDLVPVELPTFTLGAPNADPGSTRH